MNRITNINLFYRIAPLRLLIINNTNVIMPLFDYYKVVHLHVICVKFKEYYLYE